MSRISLLTTPGNPITTTHVQCAIKHTSPALSVGPKDLADHTAILAGAHEVFAQILELEDYVPFVDRERFPRVDVYRPGGAENESNAWAWKASVRARDEGAEGLLQGATVCLKDATVATRVLEAGGQITGKAVCENLSFFGASVSSATGPIHNAWARNYSAGGSSSGCAVLVAQGECQMAIGGDQGGSIRLPAAHNGIVGMKPTHGLVPYTGICQLERTIDTTGPMTKTVLDNARLLQVLAGADGIDDRQLSGCPPRRLVPDYISAATRGIRGLRVGLITESFHTEHTDPRYAAMVRAAAQKFLSPDIGTGTGGGAATVEEVSIPSTVLALDLWLVVARLSAYQSLTGKACGQRALYMNDFTKRFLPLTQDKVDAMWPSAVATLVNGAYGWENVDPTLMGKTMNLARKVRDEVDAILEQYDILITPTMPRLPARIDGYAPSLAPLEKMAFAAGVSTTTCPFSLTGHPALSLPVGLLAPLDGDDDAARLPVGMQIVGRFYDEETIYAAAYAWEQACDWEKVGAA